MYPLKHLEEGNMEFLIAYSCSILFVLIAERRCRNQKLFFCFWSTLAVLSISVLNWIRDYSIGTDIEIYGNAVFLSAVRSHSISNFFYLCQQIGMTEYGYAILNYVISFFTDNPHVFYLIIGLIVNGLFFYSCYLTRDNISITIAWATYLFLLYPTTLNLLRQSIAIALILFMGMLALNKQYVPAMLLLLLSYNFHHSSLIGILILIYIFLLNRNNSGKTTTCISTLFIILCTLLPIVIQYAYSRGLLSDKYAQYMSYEGANDSLINSLLIRLPFVILALVCMIRDRNLSNVEDKALWTLVIIELALVPLKLVSVTVFRIALYFNVFKILGYGSLCKSIRIPVSIMYLLYVAYLFFYFLNQTVYGGANEVYPFKITNDTLI